MAPALPSSSAASPFGARRRRRPWVLIALVVAIALVGIVLLLFSTDPAVLGWHRSTAFLPLGGGFLGVLLIVWAVFLAVRIAWWTSRLARGGPGGAWGGRHDPALFIARRRYARGEITREQYDQIVSDLRRPPGPP